MGGEFAAADVERQASRVIRSNGLQAPYDPLQMLSWGIVTFLAGSFCGLLAHVLPGPWDKVTLAGYVVDLAVVLLSGFETGRRDPIDPYVLVSDEDLEGPELLKCGACSSRVNKLSRHCLICDKCVVDYDHHCKWLNNCIGAKNYRAFICLIVSTLVLVGLQLVVCAVLFAKYVVRMDDLQSDLDSSATKMDAKLCFGIVCTNLFVGIPAFMMVAHLVGFHIYLGSLGLTTYNYVMKCQAEEDAKKKSSEKYLEESCSDSDDVDSDEDLSPPTTHRSQNAATVEQGQEAKSLSINPNPVVGTGSGSSKEMEHDDVANSVVQDHDAHSDHNGAELNIPGQPSATDATSPAISDTASPLRRGVTRGGVRLAPLKHPAF